MHEWEDVVTGTVSCLTAGATRDTQAVLPGRSVCHGTVEDVPLFESTGRGVRLQEQ